MERSKVLPSQVLDNCLSFERFVLTAHRTGLIILRALSNGLKLTGCDRIEHKNRMTESSKSAMDLGCLSLLFHAEAGLQIRLKESLN
jgi:hypothetical protein